MNVGDVIWQDSIHAIRFEKNLGAPGYFSVKGKIHSGARHKGFQFCLYKDNAPFKYFSSVTEYPYNYDLIKSEVINAFKKYI